MPVNLSWGIYQITLRLGFQNDMQDAIGTTAAAVDNSLCSQACRTDMSHLLRASAWRASHANQRLFRFRHSLSATLLL